ncbi:hypothetical protein NG726_16695 [Pseudomonas sp. MOB-449]|nr:hypothetical protein [Pseudomonas sp. MOB-449]
MTSAPGWWSGCTADHPPSEQESPLAPFPDIELWGKVAGLRDRLPEFDGPLKAQLEVHLPGFSVRFRLMA